jgi:hypothetical protein
MASDPASHPVLSTIEPVVSAARRVRIREPAIEEVAGWMAYEALPWLDLRSPLIPEGHDADTLDFIFLTATINFAFTDFERHVPFTTHFAGAERSDSDAMMACLKRALDAGTPLLDGAYLARIGRDELARIFTGSLLIPLLDERLAIFHEVGRALEARHGGRFHHLVESTPPTVADLLGRLIEEFPSFRDETTYRGRPVVFLKRAQLLLWLLHARFRGTGFFALEDPEELTIFADYIVPVALRLLGITEYSAELERAIQARQVLPRDSEEEVEIRATAIWACQLLTAALNRRRPPDRQIIPAVLDARLWTHYHETHWPHHLTITTAY